MVDKRRHKRFQVNGLEGDIFNLFDTNVININMRGIGIETTRQIDLNRECIIKIQHKDILIDFKGRVIWMLPAKKENKETGENIHIYRAGIRFLDLCNEKTDTILSALDKNSGVTERRIGGVRLSVSNPGIFKLYFPSRFSVRNISFSGMFAETETCIDMSSCCEMTLLLQDKILNLIGRVVHFKNGSSLSYRYAAGIEFVDIKEDDKIILDEYIKSLEKFGAA
ncbi:MAG: PilZ domain-containing protein [Nitrospirae bacterium]|jgi:Tfp pilus assembly protein PilZ|nr:PilZ domain-containing protein [Nitrospirota bacterium]